MMNWAINTSLPISRRKKSEVNDNAVKHTITERNTGVSTKDTEWDTVYIFLTLSIHGKSLCTDISLPDYELSSSSSIFTSSAPGLAPVPCIKWHFSICEIRAQS